MKVWLKHSSLTAFPRLSQTLTNRSKMHLRRDKNSYQISQLYDILKAKNKNPSYVYCARVTRLVMALVYCCSLDGLIASIVLLICTSLWIKASTKCNVNVRH